MGLWRVEVAVDGRAVTGEEDHLEQLMQPWH